MACEDMIINGLNGGKIQIINGEYDPKSALKHLEKTYSEIIVPSRYKKAEANASGGGLFGRRSTLSMDPDLQKLLDDSKIEEMLLKSNGSGISMSLRKLQNSLLRKQHTVLFVRLRQ